MITENTCLVDTDVAEVKEMSELFTHHADMAAIYFYHWIYIYPVFFDL